MHDHAVDAQHLHEQPEGRCITDADGLVVLEHAVGIVHRLAFILGNGRHRAAVKADVCRHPFINGKLLFVIAHAVGDYLVKHALCHTERLLVLIGKVGGIARLVRIGYLRRRLYDVLAADGDVVLLRNVLGLLASGALFKRLYLEDGKHVQRQKQNKHHRRYNVHYSNKLSFHVSSSFRILIRLKAEKVPPKTVWFALAQLIYPPARSMSSAELLILILALHEEK